MAEMSGVDLRVHLESDPRRSADLPLQDEIPTINQNMQRKWRSARMQSLQTTKEHKPRPSPGADWRSLKLYPFISLCHYLTENALFLPQSAARVRANIRVMLVAPAGPGSGGSADE
jgi:hypothetical protein